MPPVEIVNTGPSPKALCFTCGHVGVPKDPVNIELEQTIINDARKRRYSATFSFDKFVFAKFEGTQIIHDLKFPYYQCDHCLQPSYSIRIIELQLSQFINWAAGRPEIAPLDSMMEHFHESPNLLRPEHYAQLCNRFIDLHDGNAHMRREAYKRFRKYWPRVPENSRLQIIKNIINTMAIVPPETQGELQPYPLRRYFHSLRPRMMVRALLNHYDRFLLNADLLSRALPFVPYKKLQQELSLRLFELDNL